MTDCDRFVQQLVANHRDVDVLVNRMFPDSDAARSVGDKKAPQKSADQIALQQLLRGVHF